MLVGRGEESSDEIGGVKDNLSWCPEGGEGEGGFVVEDTGGAEPARNNEEDDGDDFWTPSWWNSWPSVCCAGRVSVAAMAS